MKITYLLACKNSSNFIKSQIESILSQKNVDVYISVSDDNSTDDTLSILEEYKNFSNIEVFNNNFNSFFNNFIFLILNTKYSNSDYFAFSDHDDLFDEYKSINAINALKKFSCDGYSCSVKTFKYCIGDGKIISLNKNISHFDFLFQGAGNGCTFVYSLKLFKLFSLFLLNNKTLIQNFYFHDWLLYLFTRSVQLNWFFDINHYVNYRLHNNSTFGSKTTLSGIIKRFNLINNNWYYDQILIALKIFISINPDDNFISKIYQDSISRSFTFRKLMFILTKSRRSLIERFYLLFLYFLGKI